MFYLTKDSKTEIQANQDHSSKITWMYGIYVSKRYKENM